MIDHSAKPVGPDRLYETLLWWLKQGGQIGGGAGETYPGAAADLPGTLAISPVVPRS